MAKTLGCLVGAMTAGALFLHWIEPASPPTDTRYAVQLRALEVKQSVRPDDAATPVRWRGVIIRSDGGHGDSAGRSHFRVTSGGELIKGAMWTSQRDPNTTGFIEVALDTPKGRNGALTPQQANTLIALLSELRQGYISGGGEVQLDERSFATDGRSPGQPQTQRLKELLQSAGINS
jgi:hypothetical protein